MVLESTTPLRRGAVVAPAVVMVIRWCWLATLSASSIAKDKESLRSLGIPGSGSEAVDAIDPRVEGVKSATLVTVRFILGLAAALRFGIRGWKGVRITGILVFLVQWLLVGVCYGNWTNFRILPLAAAVVSLPAGDILAQGKNRRTRAIFCIGLSSIAFLLAAILQMFLVVLLHRTSTMRPLHFFFGTGIGEFIHGTPPCLPVFLAWVLTVSPLPPAPTRLEGDEVGK